MAALKKDPAIRVVAKNHSRRVRRAIRVGIPVAIMSIMLSHERPAVRFIEQVSFFLRPQSQRLQETLGPLGGGGLYAVHYAPADVQQVLLEVEPLRTVFVA